MFSLVRPYNKRMRPYYNEITNNISDIKDKDTKMMNHDISMKLIVNNVAYIYTRKKK